MRAFRKKGNFVHPDIWYNNNFLEKSKDKMAHHASAKKRIRQTEKRRLVNRYYKKTARTSMKKLREMKDPAEAGTFLIKVISMLDKLAKNNNIHKNKAANLKSGLTLHVNRLSAALAKA